MRCLRMAPFVLLVATLALAFGVAPQEAPDAGSSVIPVVAQGTCPATCPPCPPCPAGPKTQAVDADFHHPNPAVVPHAIVY